MQGLNEEENKQVDELVRLLVNVSDEDAVEDILLDLFTLREIRDLASRLQVAKMLSAKMSYAEIEHRTGVSATTIARVSKCLTQGSGGYAKALELLAQNN